MADDEISLGTALMFGAVLFFLVRAPGMTLANAGAGAGGSSSGGTGNAGAGGGAPGGGSKGGGNAGAGGAATGPRGLRNNNPGNLIDNGIAWQGKTGSDGTFVKFDTAANGLRALVLNLMAKFREGNDTPKKIAYAWSTTDQAAYAKALASALKVAETATISPTIANLATLTAAIVQEENGQNPFTRTQIVSIITAVQGTA